METLKTSETLIQGLVTSKQDEIGNLSGETVPGVSQSFDLGKVKCAESHHIDSYKVNGVDRVDSSRPGDVSIKGISLFVELTGEMTNKRDVDAESRLLSENRVDVGQQEPEVSEGDLVWGVISNKHKQLWWPGIVCDGANAPKEAANGPMREDDILVRCFGNRSFVWCSPYEVKPFVGYFDQLPNQSNAKKYLDALGKAVTELGHRVKTEFTCSCFSKMKMEKTGHLGDLSVARFEPAKFLDYIKDLGKNISMPQEIDYVVKQSCLSAFYQSLGHLQIPMDQLEPAKGSPLMINTEDENGYFVDTGKCSETRERGKNNDLNHGSTILDFQNVRSLNLEAQSMAANQPPPCKFVPIRPKKNAENITFMHTWNADTNPLPNVNQMEGLYHGSVFYFRNEFGLIQPYFTGNHGESQAGPVPVPTGLSHVPKKRGRKRKNIDLQANPGPTIDLQTNPGSIPPFFTGNHGVPQAGPVPTGLSHVPKKRGRKRKNTHLQANPGSTIDFQANPGSTMDLQANPGSTIDLQANPGSTIDLQANHGSTIIPNLNGKKKQKRVERSKEVGVPCIDLSYNKVQQDDLEVKGTAFLLKFSPDYPLPSNQDLNSAFSKFGELIESETQVSIENLSGQVVFLDSSKAGGAFWGLQKDKPFGPVLVNYKIQHLSSSESLAPFKTPIKSPSGPTIDFQAKPGSITPYFTGNHGVPQVGPVPVPTGLSHVPKKRGRKRKNRDLQANPGSTVDLLANDFSTINLQANPGSTIDFQANPGLTIIPNSNGQKKQKGVERSKEVGVPCIDLSYNKVQQDNLEVKGTAFLLKFSPDYPLPSNQDLNSAFSKFGELIESETQVSTENLSGQVVFLDSSSAGGAFWGLQSHNPFGPVLVNYKIQHLAGSESMAPFKTPITSPSCPKPMDSKAIMGPTVKPELNTNPTEIQIMKSSKTIEEIRPLSNDNILSYSKVHHGNEEATGAALLLKFSPNHPLPRLQDLNLVFCKYGILNELETRVSSQDFTGQVVFVNPSAAGDAIHRLEKDRPFGPALLSYRVHHLYSVKSAVQVKNPVNVSLKSKPPQDLGVIKKNLEMMNLMLEKSGDSLSPEMRRKLENEIKGLMKKVSAMDGSSSAASSCL
ncbi:hypothetical protein SSX86_000261 [Deinandra increscens subsp. villosa]|uniref:PWWP domain-containing protein n=1 Tax=Deinandra increscens subsp. villosa TaxID=3103831 RepID=A0AAP0H9X5_9ASTR